MFVSTSSYQDKLFVPSLQTRKLLQRFAAGGVFIRGTKLKPLENQEKKKLLNEIFILSEALANLLQEISDVTPYQKLLLSLASSSPVCSYVHPSEKVGAVIAELIKEEQVRKNPQLVGHIHQYVPVVFEIVERCDVSDNLKIVLQEMWNIAMYTFLPDNSVKDNDIAHVSTSD